MVTVAARCGQPKMTGHMCRAAGSEAQTSSNAEPIPPIHLFASLAEERAGEAQLSKKDMALAPHPYRISSTDVNLWAPQREEMRAHEADKGTEGASQMT